MVDRAVEEGLPPEHKNELRRIVYDHHDVWRVKLDRIPPVKVTPMKLHLKHDAQPVACGAGKYPIPHQQFLHEHCASLLENDFIYRNPQSRYASRTDVHEKKDFSNRGYRMTADYRPVNRQIERVAWPMPHLDVVLMYLRTATIFMLFDAFKGYWQFPLHVDSQEICSFMTHEGNFTPKRIMQGICDAVFAFQSGMQEVLGELLYLCVLLWIDDVLGYVSDFKEYFTVLKRILKKFASFGVKCNPNRCHLFLKRVKWCGRIISSEGVSYDPDMICALKAMSIPQTAADLQQFICGLNWMRSAIPRFAERVHPLQQLLLEASRSIGSLKKRQLRRIRLDHIGWGDQHSRSFEALKEILANLMTTAHPKDGWIVCMFPDASNQFWSVFLTQIPYSDLVKSYDEQQHEPLAFISGSFKDNQLRWATIEKEAFAIVEGCFRLKHFLYTSLPFRIFTDHRNLAFILDPYRYMTSPSRTTGDRLERWRLQLEFLNFEIEHIPGDENIWADLGTLWGGLLLLRKCQVLFVYMFPTSFHESSSLSRLLHSR
ncbi:Reverse transcriptase domain-containing protein [Plasmodiophora brassicae]|uniref:Reverse transcriptase domain-containing protein n=1 Tax=Plasmodiophora brassicae TaxID=37360 RepID=A0A0G4ITT3_PLABS|nr:hypothetical protein PBRA_006847 [Plasmodiophora brassicae]